MEYLPLSLVEAIKTQPKSFCLGSQLKDRLAAERLKKQQIETKISAPPKIWWKLWKEQMKLFKYCKWI